MRELNYDKLIYFPKSSEFTSIPKDYKKYYLTPVLNTLTTIYLVKEATKLTFFIMDEEKRDYIELAYFSQYHGLYPKFATLPVMDKYSIFKIHLSGETFFMTDVYSPKMANYTFSEKQEFLETLFHGEHVIKPLKIDESVVKNIIAFNDRKQLSLIFKISHLIPDITGLQLIHEEEISQFAKIPDSKFFSLNLLEYKFKNEKK